MIDMVSVGSELYFRGTNTGDFARFTYSPEAGAKFLIAENSLPIGIGTNLSVNAITYDGTYAYLSNHGKGTVIYGSPATLFSGNFLIDNMPNNSPVFTMKRDNSIFFFGDTFTRSLTKEPAYSNLLYNMKATEIQGGVYHTAYMGTGTTGVDNPNVINFTGAPEIAVISSPASQAWYVLTRAQSDNGNYVSSYQITSSQSLAGINVRWGENTLSWYHSGNSAYCQLNELGKMYHVMFIY